jgi:hypothetical protein
MGIVQALAFLAGLVIVTGTLFSAIETFILPRSVQDVLTRAVFQVVRIFFNLALKGTRTYQGRDRIMSFYAPLALLSLLPVWYGLVAVGYALLFWASGASSIFEALRDSGSSLLTLGYAAPDGPWQTLLVTSEAVIGLILVALLIAYLPTMYAAFSRREAAVTMLEVRAGNPPSAVEMLKRYYRIHGMDRLRDVWANWEVWFADIEESHTSLPALVFFRSPQGDRSWITAAGAVLDAAALALSVVDIPDEPQAALCIRAGYLSLRKIGDFFSIPYNPNPARGEPVSVSRAEFDEACAKLADQGIPLKPDRETAWLDFSGWRVNYDLVLLTLAKLTMAPPAPWTGRRDIIYTVPLFGKLQKHP